ncbi:MAG: BMP family ABC transporter substrate-binding protein [Spirochaetaceae bacterium]|jgi:basic membrane protein A|nr:BMP family ABC transporter substrate-binding protein [Spirochaetaceae bacterium]
MKKVIGLLMTGLLLLSLIACSKSAAKTAEGGSTRELVYVFIKNRGDLAYWDSIAEGGDRAASAFSDKANIRVVETTADLTANLTAMYEAADAGAGLIITASDYKDNLVEVANKFPNIPCVIIGEDVVDQAKNIYGIDFRVSEASFLAGVVAADIASQGIAGTQKSNVIGFIGGMDETVVIQEFFVGYIQGAKYYDPNVSIVYNYVGGWGDPDTARTQALAQYNDAKAEVIFACAGGSGNGVHTAASEVGKYVVGVDSDQTQMYRSDPDIRSRFVTSVLKLCNNAVYNVIDNHLQGKALPVGVYQILGVAEDSVGIVENDLFNSYVSAAGKAKLEQAKADISGGKVTIQSAIGKEQPEIKALITDLIR